MQIVIVDQLFSKGSDPVTKVILPGPRSGMGNFDHVMNGGGHRKAMWPLLGSQLTNIISVHIDDNEQGDSHIM